MRQGRAFVYHTIVGRSEARRGFVYRALMDANGDGKPERVERYRHGVLVGRDLFDGDRLAVRETHDNTRLVAREYDANGDGVFERRVEFDALGEATRATP